MSQALKQFSGTVLNSGFIEKDAVNNSAITYGFSELHLIVHSIFVVSRGKSGEAVCSRVKEVLARISKKPKTTEQNTEFGYSKSRVHYGRK